METISRSQNKRRSITVPLIYLGIILLIVAVYLLFIRPALMPSMATVGPELIVFFVLLIAFAITLIVLIITALAALIRAALRKGRDKGEAWRALRRRAIWCGALAAALAVTVLLSQWLAYTPPIRAADGSEAPGSIAALEQVELNGSRQWVSIRGKDASKPVLLFLAGGPGGSQLAAVRSELGALEEYFVVVGWDQPGAAKSYGALPKNELTRQRYVDNGCALAEYLCERFEQEKIYLVGESWGSALGVWMAQQRPELFHAVVGTGQMVAFLETEHYCYNLAMQIAEERGHADVVRQLEAQGPPPYYGSGVAMKMASYLMYLFQVMAADPDIAPSSQNTLADIAAPEYGLYDKLGYVLGVTDTLGVVYQQLYDLDLRQQAAELHVPVYFFIGRHDINAPTALVEDYYSVLQAPHKELVWFERSGHMPWVEESELFIEKLLSVVRQAEPA
ncbi:MAG: alpha/beta fold hydrolase [Christensenellales bacterium]|jgi:pimeloyl-ACP methyl ester carboxylesterase